MPVDININRLQILLAEMHSFLPDGYRIAFVARNVRNPRAHVVLTDMSKSDIEMTMTEAGMESQPNAKT